MKKAKLSAVEFLQKPYKKQIPDLEASGKKNHLAFVGTLTLAATAG